MSASARIDTEQSLQRIEQLVGALDAIKDGQARTAARELLQAVLDLHGLALAKIAARLSASEEGRAIYARLSGDEHVKAVLLLYGLHPQPAEERIRAAAADLEVEFGVSIAMVCVSDGIARLRVGPGLREWDWLCREIGGRLIDAAPDLDDIAIERDAALATTAG
jgi:hypothetical protein